MYLKVHIRGYAETVAKPSASSRCGCRPSRLSFLKLHLQVVFKMAKAIGSRQFQLELCHSLGLFDFLFERLIFILHVYVSAYMCTMCVPGAGGG